jgi:hypothetical protein
MRQGPVYRVVGPPPDSDARPEERLRWVRRFYRFRCGPSFTGGSGLAVAVCVAAVIALRFGIAAGPL